MYFPLLNLPSIASEEIIEQMDVREQFLMATLSYKAQFVVTRATYRQKYNMRIDADDYHIGNNTDVVIRIAKIGSKNIDTLWVHMKPTTGEISVYDNVVTVYSDDVIDTALDVLDFVANIFRKPVIYLISFDKLPTDLPFILVPFLKKIELKVVEISLETFETNDNLVNFLLSECREVSKLSFGINTTPNFQPEVLAPLKTQEVEIFNADWLTMEHISSYFMNCIKLDISSCKMTSESLNMFLKTWINGSPLESVEIRYDESIPFHFIFEGIEKRPAIHEYRKPETFLGREEESYMIRQQNGVEALVGRSCLFAMKFFLTTKFCDDRVEYDVQDEDN